MKMNNFLNTTKNYNKKEDIIQWIGVILFMIIVYIFIYNSNKNVLKSIKEKRLYTVGIISGFSRTKTTKFVKYIYSSNKNTFEKEFSIDKDIYSIGDRVLIVFNPESKNSILLPYFIDDSIKEPYSGWNEPPMNNITDDDVIKYLEKNY